MSALLSTNDTHSFHCVSEKVVTNITLSSELTVVLIFWGCDMEGSGGIKLLLEYIVLQSNK